MGLIDSLRGRWEEMDEIDRRNLYIALVFAALLVVLFYSLSNTFNVLGGFLGGGTEYVDETVSSGRALRP